jgi:anti-anti-sigma factor
MQLSEDAEIADGARSFAVQASSEGETLRLHVSGEFDPVNTAELARALHPTSMTSVRRVIVDLSDVTFLDSASLHALVDGKAILDRYGIALRLIASSDSVTYRLLELTHLSERFELPTGVRNGSATTAVTRR